MLSPHLNFSASPLPPSGSTLLVSDTLTADWGFVLYHLLIAAKTANLPVVWVDFRGETEASLSSSLRRLGSSLPQSFTTITPSHLPKSLSPGPHLFDPPSLRSTYDAVAVATSPPSLVILDGLSTLTRSGFSPADVARFVRAVANPEITLVASLHADHLPAQESADGDLLPRLLRFADFWWRVSGLQSGRSGDVSGEISCHVLKSHGPQISRAAPLQYRLEVGSVKVFAKGTGRGYL